MIRWFATFSFFFFFAIGLSAQKKQSAFPYSDKSSIAFKKYFKENPPNDFTDSVFVSSYGYLNQLINADSTLVSIERVKYLIESNRAENELLNIFLFRTKIDSLNSYRRQVLAYYWERQRLQNIVDTGEISSYDSLFFEAVEVFLNKDTLNIDSLLYSLEPYNDTLLRAIDDAILKFKNHEYLKWIKDVRNDTVNLYLVNMDGDSLLVKLYHNNPNLIRFDLTDYWGTNIPAVIRNVEKRSFRILINDTPEIDYETDEKAKQAMGGLGTINSDKKLTVTPRVVEILRPLWLKGGNVSIDLSQVGMYQWAKGGNPSFSFLGGFELFAKYKKDKNSWDNYLKCRYGMIRQGRYVDETVDFRSNEDRIELSSKYGYNVFGFNYISVEGDFKSQFAPAYSWNGNVKGDEIISEFMSPGYLTFSLGLDYKPDEKTTLFLAPISSKITYVLNDSSSVKKRYSVADGSNARYEIGARIKASYKVTIWENIEVKNSLELFSSYIEKSQNIDVNWEFNIILPVNDFIRAKITSNFIYDDNTSVPKYRENSTTGIEEKYDGKGAQYMEMIAIGFAFKF